MDFSKNSYRRPNKRIVKKKKAERETQLLSFEVIMISGINKVISMSKIKNIILIKKN